MRSRNEAIECIASMLKENDEQVRFELEMRLGNRGAVVMEKIDYRANAEQLFDSWHARITYKQVVQQLKDTWCPPLKKKWWQFWK